MLTVVMTAVIAAATFGVGRFVRLKRRELVYGPAPAQVLNASLVVLAALLVGAVYLRG